MMFSKKKCAFLAACVALSSALPADPIKLAPFSSASPRMSALGGAHAAHARGIEALFENPAGFADEDTVFSVGALSLLLQGPIFDIANLMFSGSGIMTGLPTLLDAKGRLLVGADLDGPISFGFVGKGLGFGIFNKSFGTIDVIDLLNASLSTGEELLMVGGYAYRFKLPRGHDIDIGIMPKAFLRAEFTKEGSALDLIGTVMDTSALLGATTFRISSGIGFDVGARWTSPFGLAIGFVARDAYTPAMVSEYSSFTAYQADSTQSPVMGIVPADLSLGLVYDLPFRFFEYLGIDVAFMADYHDFLNLFAPVPRNAILNAGAGVEICLLDILLLRAGIRDALPSAGFGLDLSWFAMNLAMFGRELGLEPGSRPVFNLALSLEFRY